MIPSNMQELNKWFADKWLSLDGLPRAYFELPQKDGTLESFTYEAWAVKTRSRLDPEGQLVKAVYDDLNWVLEAKIQPLIFWRNRPSLETEVVQLYGKLLATREQVQDGAPVPPGAVNQFETGNYFEDVGKVLETSLYMRFNIPALNWHKHRFIWGKEQGAVIRLLETIAAV